MDRLEDVLRDPARALAPDAALSQPVAMLQGVTAAAEQALAQVGIATVLDLAASALFGTARAIADAADGVSRLGAPGPMPADMLDDEARGASAAAVAAMGLEVLRSLTPGLAQGLAQALPAATVRDLGHWPPAVAAQRLLRVAYGGIDDTVDPESPLELQPRMGRLPVDRVQYDVLLFETPLDKGPPEPPDLKGPDPLAGFDGIEFPLDLTDAVLGRGFEQPGVGFVLTIAQSWYSVGLSLGQLLHSLALAPGEATRVAVVDWSRRVATATGETIAESEALSAALERNRSVSEVTQAVNSEAQQGFSHFNTTGAAWGIGGGVAGKASKGTAEGAAALDFGFSRTDAQGRSFSSSQGQRSVAADMAQQAHDRTQQFASLSRSRRASLVSEVSVSEAERLSTRVVANYNHMHALSVLYFEVVQLYRVVTECVSSEPVLYLPVRAMDFDRPGLLDRYRSVLAQAALSTAARDALLGTVPAPTPPSAPAGSVVDMAFFNPSLTPELWGPRGERLQDAALRKALGDEAVVEANHLRFSSRHARLSEVQVGSVDASRRPVADTLVVKGAAGNTQLLAFAQWARPPKDPAKFLPELGDSLTAFRARLPDGWSSREPSTVIETEAAWSWDKMVTLGALSFGPSVRLVFELLDPATASPQGGTVHLDMALPLTSEGGRMRIATHVQVPAGDGPAAAPAGPPFDLPGHLRAHALHYTMALLRLADPSLLGMLLGSLRLGGRSVLGQIDPVPVATVGNHLVFRWPAVRTSTWWGKLRRARGLVNDQGEHTQGRREALVPVASGGVFAEAVLGRFNAAEKLDLTRFWNWQDSPIPLVPSDIAPLQAGVRSGATAPTPGALGSANLQTQTAPSLPDPSGALAKAIDAASQGGAFRDMSGLNPLLERGGQAMVLAAQGAQDFMKTAMASVSAYGARVNQGKKMDQAAEAKAAQGGAAEATGGGTPSGGPSTGNPGPVPASKPAPPQAQAGPNEQAAFSGPTATTGALPGPPAARPETPGPRKLRFLARVVHHDSATATATPMASPGPARARRGVVLSGTLALQGLYSIERPEGDVSLTLRQGAGTTSLRLTEPGSTALEATLYVSGVEGVGFDTVPSGLSLPGTPDSWLDFTLSQLEAINPVALPGLLLPEAAAGGEVHLQLSTELGSSSSFVRQMLLAGMSEETVASWSEAIDIDLATWLGPATLGDDALRAMAQAIALPLAQRRQQLAQLVANSNPNRHGAPVLGGAVTFDGASKTLTVTPRWGLLIDSVIEQLQ